MGHLFANRRTGRRRVNAPALLRATLLTLCIAFPSFGWAQSQAATASADTTASPESDDSSAVSSDTSADPETLFPHFKDTRFWLSGQTNFIFQTHPDFHADYSGPHSLSRTMTRLLPA